jgi:hypothetical protein
MLLDIPEHQKLNGTTPVSDERHAPGVPNWLPRAKVL